MISRVFVIASLFLSSVAVIACSSSSESTKTTEASAKTIDGVCAKLGKLSCAQPNCVEKLTLAHDRCTGTYDDFQGMVDCLSLATFTCDGSPYVPRTAECQADVRRIDLCASDSSGNPPTNFDAGPAPGTCFAGSECQIWPCGCADGTIVSMALCQNGKCADAITACSGDSLENACKSHGGTIH